MPWSQHLVTLKPRSRGVHLVTDELVAGAKGLAALRIGFCQFFLQHTSAALVINENADPSVRSDLERWLDRLAPDGAPFFAHTDEGRDDMPAHAKSAMLGGALVVPIADGRLALGTWQGVYLVECRDHGGARRVVVTMNGED